METSKSFWSWCFRVNVTDILGIKDNILDTAHNDQSNSHVHSWNGF
jgi:hypothetical protein